MILLAAALAVFAGAWFALRPAEELPAPNVARPVTLRDRDTEDIAAITVENAGGAYTLRREAEGWRVAGADYDLREALLTPLINDAALIVAEDTVGDLAEHPEWQLAHFGLDPAAVRVMVTDTDGSVTVFRVGDAVPQENPAHYLYVEGDSHVYTVGDDVYDAYITTPLELHEVPELALKADLIDGIAVTGENPFAIERRADGWYLTEPVRYPLSDAAVSALLDKLAGLRFAQFAADALEADLAAYGLDAPRRVITLDIAESVVTSYDENGQPTGEARLPAYQLTLALGDGADSVVFNCLYRDAIYRVTVFTAGFLRTQTYDALLLDAPFNAPTNDLISLSWQNDLYAVSLRERVLPNNALETDENGNLVYDLAVTKNSAPLDSEAFLTAYRQLLELRTADRLPADYTLPDQAPLLRAVVTRSASVREIALYPVDALHRAVAIDGVALFQVEKGWGEGVALP